MKQSAVEWLAENVDNLIPFMNDEIAKKFCELVEQAKDMERQQLIDAYRDGRSDQQSEKPSRFYNRNAEQYYNENYKKL